LLFKIQETINLIETRKLGYRQKHRLPVAR